MGLVGLGGVGWGWTDARILVLDEMDQLLAQSKKQEVLYKLFDWAARPMSRLILVGIANSLDLTQKFLPQLGARKCKPLRLNFSSYTAPQIQQILQARVWSATLREGTEVEALRVGGDVFSRGTVLRLSRDNQSGHETVCVRFSKRVTEEAIPVEFVRQPPSHRLKSESCSATAKTATKFGTQPTKKRARTAHKARDALEATQRSASSEAAVDGIVGESAFAAMVAPAALEFCARKVMRKWLVAACLVMFQ